MSKMDQLRRSMVGNIDESMGGGRTPGATIPREYPSGPKPPPARYQDVRKRSDVSDIPVAKIVADPDQPRKHFDSEALDRLAASLKAKGQLQPIRVRWSEGLGYYVVIVGERRFQAALRAGITSLACVVVDGELSPGELLAIQLVENALREDLQPIEQAKAYRALMEQNGWSQTRLAEELGVTQSAVAKAMATLELPEDVQAMVDSGALDPSKAYQVSKVEGEEAQREVAARVVAEGLSREETAEVVRQVTPKASKSSGGKGRGAAKGKPIKLPTERKQKAPNGIKILCERRKGFDLLEWIDALRFALESAEAIQAEQGGEAGGASQPDGDQVAA